MARIFQTGFEIAPATTATTTHNPDGSGGAGGISTAYARSGASSLRLTDQVKVLGFGGSYSKVFCRFYLYKSANPASPEYVVRVYDSSVVKLAIALDSTGRIGLYADGTLTTQIGSWSSALNNGQWYKIEYSWDATGTGVQAVLRIEGTTTASGQVHATATSATKQEFNYALSTVYVDDLVVNDSTGSVHNTWPVDSKIVLLTPISDSQDGTWTIASGGNTNLYDAVNNKPVIGTSPSLASDGNRIESVDSSGDNSTDEARFGMTSYSTAGIASGDTINALALWVLAGEEVGTGTKAIAAGFYSNPANSAYSWADVTLGTSGAVGTYQTAWHWLPVLPGTTVLLENPSVTLATSPVVNLRKTDTGTRSATVGFIGVYVDYTPLAGITVSPLVGTLRLVGQTPTVSKTAHITRVPSSGTLRFIGQQPTALVPVFRSPLVGTLRFIGQQPTVTITAGAVTAPTVGTLRLVGQQPTVNKTDNHARTPLVGTLRLVGQQPTVAKTAHWIVAPTTGTLRLVGQQPTVSKSAHVVITPSLGTIRFVGQQPTVAKTENVIRTPVVGVLRLVGQQPTVTRTGNVWIAPSVGTLRFVGNQPTVQSQASITIAPAAGTVRFVGQQPSITKTANVWVSPSGGALRVVGQQPTVSKTAHVITTPSVGALRLVGQQPTVSFTAHIARAPAVGTLRLVGQQPTVAKTANWVTAPAVGTLRLIGQQPTVSKTGHVWTTPTGPVLRLVGQTPTIQVSASGAVQPFSGTLRIIGRQPTVTHTGHVWIDPESGELRFIGQQPTIQIGSDQVVAPVSGMLRFVGNDPLIAVSGAAANDQGTPGGSGYPVYWQGKRRKRRLEEQPNLHLKKVLDDVVNELYGELIDDGVAPEVQAKAAKLVKKFVKKNDKKLAIPPEAAVDWQALEKDAARVRQLVALWRKQEWEAEIEAEDEYLLMIA